MKLFDLHPKAATSARTKSAAGGLLTISTVFIALILLVQLALNDLSKRTEDVQIDSIGHGETLEIDMDILFTTVGGCSASYQVDVIDALGRPIADPKADMHHTTESHGCRIFARFHVPAGKGTFRMYPSVMMSPDSVHANHRVNKIVVGNELPGVPKEARALKTEVVTTDKAGAWSYYLSLVPTTSNGVRGYQIAATRTFVELNDPRTARGSLFFHYEASPVRMHLESRVGFSKLLHFLARAIGILSGLFAFVGLAREILFTAVIMPSKNKKKKSELIM